MQKDRTDTTFDDNSRAIAPSRCRTCLVDDLPADHDAFGPHNRIARSIAEIVRHEDGPRAIALRGAWGTGKSTVINLMRQLSNPSLTLIYVFDAWEHRGDPLRRSFLEGLERAIRRDWGDSSVLFKETRQTVEHRDETVNLTPIGVGFLLSLLFFPLGLVLLSDWLGQLQGSPSFGLSLRHLQGALAFMLILLPLVFVAIDLQRSNGDEEDEHEIRYLLLRRPPRVTTRIERPWEVSTIEFEDRFNSILRTSLGESGSSRRLVVVLDNLDRLSKEDAVAAWAGLRPLFPMDGLPEESLASAQKFWLIVPYDPAGLNESLRSPDQDGQLASAPSMLDKAFQTHFRVPSPVMNSWKDFVLAKLGTAMPDHDTEQIEQTYRVMRKEYLRKGAHALPSPRSVKLDVNRIGSLHRQWCGHINLATIGRYVVEFERRWEKSGFVHAHLDDVNSDVAAELMALWVGVDPAEAPILLLAAAVESALLAESAGELVSVSRAPGSSEVLEHVIEERGSDWSMEPSVLARAACNLATPELAPWVSVRMWNDLWHHAEQCTPSALWDSETASGILEIVSHQDADGGASGQLLLETLSLGAAEVDAAESDPIDLSRAITTYFAGLAPPTNDSRALPFEPTIAAAVASELVEVDSKVLAWLDQDNIFEGVRLMVETGIANRRTALVVRALELEEQQRVSLLTATNTLLRRTDIDASAIPETILCLGEAIDDSTEPAENHGLRSALLHHYQMSLQGQSWSDAAILAIGSLIQGYPLASNPEALPHSGNGLNELQALIANPGHRPLFSEFPSSSSELRLVRLLSLRAAKHPPLRPLLGKVLEHALESVPTASPIAPASVVGLGSGFFNRLTADQQRNLAIAITQEPELASVTSEAGFIDSLAVSDLVAILNPPPKDLCRSIRDSANDVSPEEWATDLGGERAAWRAMNRVAQSCDWKLSTSLREGIERYARAVAAGSGSRHEPLNTRDCLDPRSRSALQQRLWELANREGTDLNRLIAVFAEPMGDTPKVAEFLGTLLSQRSHDLIGAGSLPVIQWLASILERIDLENPGRTAALTSIKTRLRQEGDRELAEALRILEISIKAK